MTKHLLSIAILFFSFITQAQDKYIVRFTDKNNSPYSITTPQAFLTQRAIDRRNTQNITVDLTDIPVNDAYIQGVIGAGATVLNKSKWFNSVTVQAGTPAVLNAINALPYVQSSINVARFGNNNSPHNKFDLERIDPVQIPAITAQRTMSLNYGNGANQVTMININALHDLGFQGQGMTIAVIDAGFQDVDVMSCFDSLFAHNQILGTWDFVSHEANVYDDYYHGTAVLSCMGANVPGDLVGTAPKASYWLLRSEESSTEYIIEEYNWASAAEFADSVGADVINSSLGYTDFDFPFQNTSHTYADMDGNTAPSTIAADMAAAKGILVVNSAGNSGGGSWQYMGAPADGDSVLAIGAVDDQGNYAFFSSTGPTPDGRFKPDVTCQGQGTFVYTPGSSGSQPGNGTSFSSPVMAGSVACLWQALPGKTNMEIIQAVKRSASQFNNPDSLLGYGIPNFGNAFVLANTQFITIDEGSDGLTVYPNPFMGNQPVTLHILNDHRQTIKLEIIDALGKLCFTGDYELTFKGQNELMFYPTLAGIGKGIFFLHVKTDDNNYVKRLIKF